MTSNFSHLYKSAHVYLLFVLKSYSPINRMGSCRVRSVYLTTLLLGRLSPLKRLTSIVQILLPETDSSLLESIERREWFHNQISTKECCQPGGDRIHNLLITSRTRIQPRLAPLFVLVYVVIYINTISFNPLSPEGNTGNTGNPHKTVRNEPSH